MTTRTHVIGDVKMKVVHNEDSGRHIALIQGEDINNPVDRSGARGGGCNRGGMRTMQYNNRAILGMIASALNPLIPAVQAPLSSIVIYGQPSSGCVLIKVTDGKQFQISVEEV